MCVLTESVVGLLVVCMMCVGGFAEDSWVVSLLALLSMCADAHA